MSTWTCLDAVVTLVTEVGSSPENRAVPATGEGRKRIEGSGYTRFEPGTPLQTGWETRWAHFCQRSGARKERETGTV
jgi:hypothetical protein